VWFLLLLLFCRAFRGIAGEGKGRRKKKKKKEKKIKKKKKTLFPSLQQTHMPQPLHSLTCETPNHNVWYIFVFFFSPNPIDLRDAQHGQAPRRSRC
jgi:hypothetical protein